MAISAVPLYVIKLIHMRVAPQATASSKFYNLYVVWCSRLSTHFHYNEMRRTTNLQFCTSMGTSNWHKVV